METQASSAADGSNDRPAVASGRRAALYTRVSTFLQKRHGYSLDAQDADCEGYAAGLDATVVARWTDNDSGADWDLPGLNAMLDAAKRREFDIVVVYAPD